MKKIPVGVSGRHVHLSQNDLEILFGKGYQLTKLKDLSQPGQFAANEKIDVISPEGKLLSGVRVLGPVREFSQVEISKSDALRGKFGAPLRESGDLKNSGSATLKGPNGEVFLNEGVIIASRHIHFSILDAEEYQVSDNDLVSVLISGDRGGILSNVLCRVSAKFKLDFHIDTDEAAAFFLDSGDTVELVFEYKVIN